MAATFTKIATVTVGSGGSSSIDFSSIPSTYTDLQLITSLRGSTNNSGNTLGLYIKINNATTNLSWRSLGDSNGSAFSQANSTNYTRTSINDTGSTSNTFSSAYFYFANYTSSNYKSFSIDSVVETNNSTPVDLEMVSFLWSSTSAINQITLTPESPLFAQYSTATLYGISKS
jgi:hypothetical protein